MHELLRCAASLSSSPQPLPQRPRAAGRVASRTRHRVVLVGWGLRLAHAWRLGAARPVWHSMPWLGRTVRGVRDGLAGQCEHWMHALIYAAIVFTWNGCFFGFAPCFLLSEQALDRNALRVPPFLVLHLSPCAMACSKHVAVPCKTPHASHAGVFSFGAGGVAPSNCPCSVANICPLLALFPHRHIVLMPVRHRGCPCPIRIG